MSTPLVPADVRGICSANRAWVKAERARNLDGIMPYIAEDAIFYPPRAEAVRGREAVREFYKEVLKMPFSEFDAASDEILVADSGDLAMDIGHFHFVFTTAVGVVRKQGRYFFVWQKADGAWKCLTASFTEDDLGD